jgi:hypothetical protein
VSFSTDPKRFLPDQLTQPSRNVFFPDQLTQWLALVLLFSRIPDGTNSTTDVWRREALGEVQAGIFFSAEISEISPKTGFIGDHRYVVIPNEIFRYSKNMSKF